jgi:hypothetical protein
MTITNSIHSFKYAWSPFILHDVIYEIIHVGDIRNDVFVSLERGEFERGTKYAFRCKIILPSVYTWLYNNDDFKWIHFIYMQIAITEHTIYRVLCVHDNRPFLNYAPNFRITPNRGLVLICYRNITI